MLPLLLVFVVDLRMMLNKWLGSTFSSVLPRWTLIQLAGYSCTDSSENGSVPPPLWASSLQDIAFPEDFYPSRSVCGTILLTLYSIVWDCRVFIKGPMLYYWLNLLASFFVFCSFPFLFYYPLGWYCGVWVFWLIGCKSLAASLALQTSFNNNNNNFMF